MALKLINGFIEFINFLAFIAVILGIIGSFFAIRIYRTAQFKTKSFVWYFLTISCLNLVMIAQHFRFVVLYMFSFDLATVNQPICALLWYTGFSCTASHAWVLVLISIDRYIKIAFPNK